MNGVCGGSCFLSVPVFPRHFKAASHASAFFPHRLIYSCTSYNRHHVHMILMWSDFHSCKKSRALTCFKHTWSSARASHTQHYTLYFITFRISGFTVVLVTVSTHKRVRVCGCRSSSASSRARHFPETEQREQRLTRLCQWLALYSLFNWPDVFLSHTRAPPLFSSPLWSRRVD